MTTHPIDAEPFAEDVRALSGRPGSAEDSCPVALPSAPAGRARPPGSESSPPR